MTQYTVLRLSRHELQRAYEAAQTGAFVTLAQLEDDEYRLVVEIARPTAPAPETP